METLRDKLILTAQRMNIIGINHGSSGNVSVRDTDGFLITPSGRDYESLKPQEIARLHFAESSTGTTRNGNPNQPSKPDPKPSSEWRIHRDIYLRRPELSAIVHVHSVSATALACLRQPIPAFHYMVAAAGGIDIRCADYATFGTQALSDAVVEALQDRRACLMANHGMIACGDDLKAALELAQEVEILASQYLLACQAGTPQLLTKQQMAEALDGFADYRQQSEL